MKKISKICVLILTFVLMVSLPILSLSAETNYTNYTLIPVLDSRISSSTDVVIEDYSSTVEWYMSNGNLYTRIRFTTRDSKTYMYYENINNNTSTLACTFRIMGALNPYFIPQWTSQFLQTIQVINQPYENNEIFNAVFDLSVYNRFLVSIGSKYTLNTLQFDWYQSVGVLYYGKFKYEGNDTEYTTMCLVRNNSSNEYLLCFTNQSSYIQGNITTFDGKEIEISSLYTYNGADFPQYIDSDQVEVSGWNDFFISIIDVPLYYLYNLLNFEIFGVNVWLGLGTLVLAGFVMLLIKKVL